MSETESTRGEMRASQPRDVWYVAKAARVVRVERYQGTRSAHAAHERAEWYDCADEYGTFGVRIGDEGFLSEHDALVAALAEIEQREMSLRADRDVLRARLDELRRLSAPEGFEVFTGDRRSHRK